jgi:hypothetical protein
VPVFRVYVDPRRTISRILATLRFATKLLTVGRHVDVVNLHGFSKKAVLVAAFCRFSESRTFSRFRPAATTNRRVPKRKADWRPGRIAPQTGISA